MNPAPRRRSWLRAAPIVLAALAAAIVVLGLAHQPTRIWLLVTVARHSEGTRRDWAVKRLSDELPASLPALAVGYDEDWALFDLRNYVNERDTTGEFVRLTEIRGALIEAAIAARGEGRALMLECAEVPLVGEFDGNVFIERPQESESALRARSASWRERLREGIPHDAPFALEAARLRFNIALGAGDPESLIDACLAELSSPNADIADLAHGCAVSALAVALRVNDRSPEAWGESVPEAFGVRLSSELVTDLVVTLIPKCLGDGIQSAPGEATLFAFGVEVFEQTIEAEATKAHPEFNLWWLESGLERCSARAPGTEQALSDAEAILVRELLRIDATQADTASEILNWSGLIEEDLRALPSPRLPPSRAAQTGISNAFIRWLRHLRAGQVRLAAWDGLDAFALSSLLDKLEVLGCLSPHNHLASHFPSVSSLGHCRLALAYGIPPRGSVVRDDLLHTLDALDPFDCEDCAAEFLTLLQAVPPGNRGSQLRIARHSSRLLRLVPRLPENPLDDPHPWMVALLRLDGALADLCADSALRLNPDEVTAPALASWLSGHLSEREVEVLLALSRTR